MSDNLKQQVSDATWLWLSDPKVGEVMYAAYSENKEYDTLIEKKVFTEEEAERIRALDDETTEDGKQILKTVINSLKADKGISITSSRSWSDSNAGMSAFIDIVRTSKIVKLKLYIDFNPAEEKDDGTLSDPYLDCWFQMMGANKQLKNKLKNICKKKFGNDYEDPYEEYDAHDDYAYADIPLKREDTAADMAAKVQVYFDKYINGLKDDILAL